MDGQFCLNVTTKNFLDAYRFYYWWHSAVHVRASLLAVREEVKLIMS